MDKPKIRMSEGLEMQTVYEMSIHSIEGEPLDLPLGLVNHKVDESKNGQAAYFDVDQETAREFSLQPRMLMSVEEAEAANLDEDIYCFTASGKVIIDPIYLSQ